MGVAPSHCVKVTDLSRLSYMPQFAHLQNKNSNASHLLASLQSLNVSIRVENLEHGLQSRLLWLDTGERGNSESRMTQWFLP